MADSGPTKRDSLKMVQRYTRSVSLTGFAAQFE